MRISDEDRRCFLVCVAAVAAGAIGAGSAREDSVKFIISKETTYITQPLRTDGLPDYIAAYNARQPGVKPEENALYWVVKAVGPLELSPLKEERTRMEARLGISGLPEEGPYLQKPYEYWAAQQGESGNDERVRLEMLDRSWAIKEAIFTRLLTPDELVSREGVVKV